MKRLYILAAIALATGLAACTPGGRQTRETLVLDSVGAERTDTIADVRMHVVYPTAGPDLLVDSLRRFIAQSLQRGYLYETEPGGVADIPFSADPTLLPDGPALLTAALRWEYNRMKTERDEVAREFDADEAGYAYPAYESSYDITLLAETDRYLTLGVQHYEFLGGAHGGTAFEGHTFSKSDGRQLGWSLFADADSPAFNRLIREGVRRYFSEAMETTLSDEALNDELLLDPGTTQIPLPQADPYLMPDGVAFVYQQYEIAPYAAGLPSFTVPYADVRPFLSAAALDLLPQEAK